MEPISPETILPKLELITSQNAADRSQAEAYFTPEVEKTPSLYTSLFVIAINPKVSDAVKMKAAILLSSLAKNLMPESKQIFEVYHSHCLEALLAAPSKPIAKQLGETLFNFCSTVRVLNDEDPAPAKAIYESFFDKLLKEIDPTRLYYLLMGYLKIHKAFAHFIKKQHLAQHLNVKVFEVLEGIAAKLSEPAYDAFRPFFYRLIAKILYMTYRYELDEYILNPVKTEFWMKFCIHILQRAGEMPEALSQVIRLLYLPFFRQSTNALNNSEKKKKDKDDYPDKQYFLEWRKKYGDGFLEMLFQLVPHFSLKDQSKVKEKTYFSISRILSFELLSKDFGPKFSKKFCEILDFLLNQTKISKREIEEYTDNPREFFSRNNFNVEEISFRISSVQIMSALLSSNEKEFVIHYLTKKLEEVKDNHALREAIYYCLEKGYAGLSQFDKSKELRTKLISTVLITDMENQLGYMRVRAMILASTILKKVDPDDDVLVKLGEITWKNTQSLELPCKNFAVLLLNGLLEFDKVREILKGSVTQLVQTLIQIVKEHEHEILISSLSEILNYYPDEIAPLIIPLMEQFMVITHKVIDDLDGSEEGNEGAEREMSAMSLLQAICTCLSLPTNQEILSQAITKLDPFLLWIFDRQEPEFDEEGIQIVQLLVKKSTPGNINPLLWKYFEFFGLSVFENLQVPQNPENKLLKLLNFNRENYLTIATFSMELIVNFCARDPQTILSKTTESGLKYIDIILNFKKQIEETKNDMIEEIHKTRNELFLAKLLIVFRNYLELHLPDLALKTFKSTIEFPQKDEALYKMVLIHNVGCLFIACPLVASNLITISGYAEDFLLKWTKAHVRASDSDIRKKSFYGMLNLIQNRAASQAFFKNFPIQNLLLFLMIDLVFIDTQVIIEAEEDEEENFNQNEKYEDEPPLNLENPKALAPADIYSFIEFINDSQMWTNELLSPTTIYEVNVIEEFDQAKAFKKTVEGLSVEIPDLLKHLYDQVSPDLKSYIEKLLTSE